MPHKDFVLGDLIIRVSKRRSSRNIRLRIAPDGGVHVSIPAWAPYVAGTQFAKERLEWIQEHLPNDSDEPIRSGDHIGKAHRIMFEPLNIDQPSSRIKAGEIHIKYPASLDPEAGAVQQIAKTASLRALRLESQKLLPQRLSNLAEHHGYHYHAVNVKKMKGRWGSCDQQQRIVLNIFLMQLPWELIDYVLVHELVHTTVLRHGPDFWAEFTRAMPDCKQRQKQMRDHKPTLRPSR